MKRRAAKPWTAADRRLLRRNYANTPTIELAKQMKRPIEHVYAEANRIGVHKSARYFAGPWSGRLTKGSPLGAGARFRPGHVPANKGLRRPGWSRGRMRETQFKKGQLSGRAALVVKPIGTERISKDGYLERKINNDLPFQRRWRAVHLIVWEAANGPLPPGHAVSFKNGDKRDRRIENLQLVKRADLMRRNSYHNYPKEIAQLVQLRGALNRQINKRGNSEDQAR